MSGAGEVPCDECGGTGRIITNPDWPTGNGQPYQEACSECSGSGIVLIHNVSGVAARIKSDPSGPETTTITPPTATIP